LKNKICVFDFETDGKDPTECSPVQLACLMIDPDKLEIVPNSEFNINFKPELLDKDPNHEYEIDLLEFHAKAQKRTSTEVLDNWKNYPSQKQSWSQFVNYLDKYHTRGSKKNMFSAPIAAGYNILRFDLNIIDRLANKYKNTGKDKSNNIFHPRDKIDLMHVMFLWFENNKDIKSLSLDSMREYLGISKDNAHDALKDVTDCAEILIRFMRLHRNQAQKIKFRNSFA
jgi:DNA polymerase III epsilon subunit-like protein